MIQGWEQPEVHSLALIRGQVWQHYPTTGRIGSALPMECGIYFHIFTTEIVFPTMYSNEKSVDTAICDVGMEIADNIVDLINHPKRSENEDVD